MDYLEGGKPKYLALGGSGNESNGGDGNSGKMSLHTLSARESALQLHPGVMGEGRAGVKR